MSRYENPKVDLEITFDPPSWQGRRFKIHHDRIILATLHRIHENGDGGIPYQTLQDTLRFVAPSFPLCRLSHHPFRVH